MRFAGYYLPVLLTPVKTEGRADYYRIISILRFGESA